MKRYVFKVPDVGEGVTEATVAQWRVAVGDRIEQDHPLVDLETDKTIVEIPAPVSGTVVSLHGMAGEKVAVGSQLVVIDTSASTRPTTTEPVPTDVAPPKEPLRSADAAAINQHQGPAAAVLAPPAVRKRARDLGIDLHRIRGCGPRGQVTHADLDAFLKDGASEAVRVLQDAPIPVYDKVEEHRVIGVRRRIAERMQEAKRRIPHFSYVEEVDVTALEELRHHLNEKYAGTRVKLTPLPFVIRALGCALRDHPEINARFDDEKGIVRRHAAVHIGIATHTPNGLMVPVVTNVQARDLWDCAAEVNRLASVAREGRATRAELSGSTITITSLGALGGVVSTPIINYPEVAIVGLNRIAERLVARNSSGVVRRMMNLSSSFDHRVIDGWNAAAFIQDMKRLLEEPAILFMN